MWAHGPFPCGEWSDLQNMCDLLILMVVDEEYLLADFGYTDGSNYTVTSTGLNLIISMMQSKVCVRHETFNFRFKEWGSLRHKL